MAKLNRYSQFLKENKDIIEFPVKKFLSIIKNEIEGKVTPGPNSFFFDFENEITLPISFYIIIDFNPGNGKTNGSINIDEVISSNFKGFKLKINIEDEIVHYDSLYSVINHELKHVHDLYYDKFKDSFSKVDAYKYLKYKYSGYPEIVTFLEISNLALEHELEARTSMIYDKLRWLKTFDRNQLKLEFEKTYVYKSLSYIKNFDYSDMLLMDSEKSIQFTNEYIDSFIKIDLKVNNRQDLMYFYKRIKDKFTKTSDESMKKCEIILDELVRDKRPYIESKLFTIEDNFSYEPGKIDDVSHLNGFITEYFT